MKRRGYLGYLGAVLIPGCSQKMEKVARGGGSPTPGIRERAKSIPYDELFRNIKDHKGDAVRYRRVRIEGFKEQTESIQRFMAILNTSTLGDRHQVYCVYRGDALFRPYDWVNLWGVVEGLETYESPLGERSVPKIKVIKMELAE